MLEKIKKAEGEISVQLADLLVFVGYFGLCLYIGGVAYITAFNNFFGITILDKSGIVEISLLFVNAVNLGVFSFALLNITILFFAIFFFLSRFVFRLYFGYAAIITIFCISIFITSHIGSYLGNQTAANSVNAGTSNLPIFKFSGENGRNREASYRLLHDDGRNLYVTKLVAAGSLVQIDILSKSKIVNYEVTLK